MPASAQQLGLFEKADVKRPGSRGGHGYYVDGKWVYGERPPPRAGKTCTCGHKTEEHARGRGVCLKCYAASDSGLKPYCNRLRIERPAAPGTPRLPIPTPVETPKARPLLIRRPPRSAVEAAPPPPPEPPAPTPRQPRPPAWRPSFDDRNGIGAVPDGENIEYMGHRRMMRPSEFLAINPPRSHEPNPKILEWMQGGGPIGHPFLEVEEEGDAYRVYGHEGRGRVQAMLALGYDEPFEVHVFVRGKRARHLSEADRARPLLPDKRIREAGMEKAKLAAEIAGLEADIQYADEELLPALDESDPRRSALVKSRAEKVGRLLALHEEFMKQRALDGTRMLGPLSIAIENRKGSEREWHAQDGTSGTTTMPHDYGYVRGTLALDGDPLDCFLGPRAHVGQVERSTVYVVETRHPPDFQAEDEHKAMIGFESRKEALGAFLCAYNGEQRFVGRVEAMPWPMFVQHCATNGAVRHGPVHVAKAEEPPASVARPRPEPHRPTWWQRGLLFFKGFGPPGPKPPGQPPGRPSPAPGMPPGAGGPPGMGMGMPPSPQPVHPEQAIASPVLAKGIAAHAPALEAAVGELTKLFPGEPIAGRLKETAGFAAKVAGARQDGQPLDAAQDFASVRLTLDDENDLALAAQRIQRTMQVSSVNDFVTQPRGQYRSYDLIVSVQGQPIEVQIRTPEMTANADALHDAHYQSARTGQPLATPMMPMQGGGNAVVDRRPRP